MLKKSLLFLLPLLVGVLIIGLAGCEILLDEIYFGGTSVIHEGTSADITITLSRSAIEDTYVTVRVGGETAKEQSLLNIPNDEVLLHEGESFAKFTIFAIDNVDSDVDAIIIASAPGFKTNERKITVKNTPPTTPGATSSPPPVVPKIMDYGPKSDDINISITDPKIFAAFNVKMSEVFFNYNTEDIDLRYFSLYEVETSTNVEGMVECILGNHFVKFTPAGDLKYSTEYKAVISGDVKSVDGVALGEDFEWTFTTAEVP